MTRHVYPSGSYCEALPSGEYAVLYANHYVETHQGAVTLPPEGSPLYLRITNVPSFQMCGQASNAYGTLHWQNGAWSLDPRIAHGVSGAIFEADGTLRIMEPAPGQSSQGYRFVDEGGAVWLGDATYGPFNGLNEWSEYRDLYVGQGNQGGGVMVWDGAALRVLETGDCRFIRVRGSGEHVAISYWKQDEGAVIVQTTLSELRALPVRETANTSPPVSTPPPIVVPPKPEPVPVSIPNQLATVQAIRAKYPTPLGDQHGAFLMEVAKACGGKLFRKDAGDHTTLPNGVNVSLDILIIETPQGPWWVDILGDAEVNAVPAWDAHPDAGQPEKFVDVSGIGAPSQPPPQQPPPSNPPPAPSVDLSVILARLDVTDARHAQDISELKAAVLKLAASIEAIKMPPPAAVTFPDYQGSIPYLGSVRLKPVK